VAARSSERSDGGAQIRRFRRERETELVRERGKSDGEVQGGWTGLALIPSGSCIVGASPACHRATGAHARGHGGDDTGRRKVTWAAVGLGLHTVHLGPANSGVSPFFWFSSLLFSVL
jgi:hypothetical protein